MCLQITTFKDCFTKTAGLLWILLMKNYELLPYGLLVRELPFLTCLLARCTLGTAEHYDDSRLHVKQTCSRGSLCR